MQKDIGTNSINAEESNIEKAETKAPITMGHDEIMNLGGRCGLLTTWSTMRKRLAANMKTPEQMKYFAACGHASLYKLEGRQKVNQYIIELLDHDINNVEADLHSYESLKPDEVTEMMCKHFIFGAEIAQLAQESHMSVSTVKRRIGII